MEQQIPKKCCFMSHNNYCEQSLMPNFFKLLKRNRLAVSNDLYDHSMKIYLNSVINFISIAVLFTTLCSETKRPLQGGV